MINLKRLHILSPGEISNGPVVYWMSRDQRSQDNWALIYSQEMALERQQPLMVVFCLVPTFLEATIRQYQFMLEGLKEVQRRLHQLHIGFQLLEGEPENEIPRFLDQLHAGLLVTDFDPLREKQIWKKHVAASVPIPIHEVDTHNIVPVRIASTKAEYGAYTLRPKINRLLPEFMDDFPKLKHHPFPHQKANTVIDWDSIQRKLKINRTVSISDWLKAGETKAGKMLHHFMAQKLSQYEKDRNDPGLDGQSNLSSYLHFGQISSQRIVLQLQGMKPREASMESFLEELIIRRELSDNFCFYNPHYDSFKGIPRWALETLSRHRKDPRPYIYTPTQFENAQTHDELWNCSQMQMVKTGKMHGYLRMYWAKKILEWTPDPEDAFHVAIYLNNKYELDGRDPNGYAGIAWALGGVHDRPWKERSVFGKIRYMSYKGCARKFNVERFVERMKAGKNFDTGSGSEND